ncbi:TetR/AcrR family transcriptional regulator [Paraburkholderia azotifigens]|uniref:TetR/AcrR family transcriptional regulator n=1 Tax=Paraburkholderia azotifigens TaxID=2057004 RepID=UPI00317B600E
MPIPPADDRRARKRARVLDLLAETAVQLFESHGYDAVTMEQIAAEADVSKGTLYNHFPTKESVLAHWIHAQLEADMARLKPKIEREASFVSAISLLLNASAAWCEKHRDYLSPYLRFRFLSFETPQSEEGDAVSGDIVGGFALLIARGQHTGELRGDVDAAHLALLFHHLYLGALMRWLTTPRLNLRKEFALIVKLFVEGAAHTGVAVPTRRKKT